MNSIDNLFQLSDAYRAARHMSEARLSTLVLGAGHRLSSLREGGDIGVRRYEAAVQWFSCHWPADAAWPSDVPRPQPSDKQGEVT